MDLIVGIFAALILLLIFDVTVYFCIGDRPLVGDPECSLGLKALDLTSCLMRGSSLVITPAIVYRLYQIISYANIPQLKIHNDFVYSYTQTIFGSIISYSGIC